VNIKIPNDHNPLMCPLCGFDHLHQTSSTCYWRPEEDGIAIQTISRKDGIVCTRNVRNAPGRRDTVCIEMKCEGCWKTSTLIIEQHKGQTLLSWMKPDDTCPACPVKSDGNKEKG